MPSRSLGAVLVLAIIGVVGCGPVIPVPSPRADLVVEASDGTGAIDFGPVFVGATAHQSVTITNPGRGTLVVEAIEVEPGGSVFSVDAEPFELASGESQVVEVSFAPTAEGATAAASLEVRAHTDGLEEDQQSVTLNLTGRGVADWCVAPKRLEFGAVAVGDVAKVGFTVRNPALIASDAFIGDPASSTGDHAAFTFQAGAERGELTLAPGEEIDVALEFRPSDARPFLAFVKLRPGTGCEETTVTVTGTGVDPGLSWSPGVLDFGYVPPQQIGTRTLTFFNFTSEPVHLTNLRILSSGFFAGEAPDAETTELTIPGATQDSAGDWMPGTAALDVGMEPAVPGPRQSMLSFDTDLATQPEGAVSLKVYGGGPDIEVEPFPTLDFGDVEWIPDAAPPLAVEQQLIVRNVGTAPATSDPNANLHLEPTTAIEVVPTNSNTSANEFIVEFPSTWDDTVGLEAKVGKSELSLSVTFTPASPGQKEALLRIHSNDLDEPIVEIELLANAITQSP